MTTIAVPKPWEVPLAAELLEQTLLKFEPVEWPPLPPPPPPFQFVDPHAWFAETRDGLTLRVLGCRENFCRRYPKWLGWHLYLTVAIARRWDLRPCTQPTDVEVNEARRLRRLVNLKLLPSAYGPVRHLLEFQPT